MIKLFHADTRSEFQKRASCISDKERHIFHPLMEKCLAEMLPDRCSFLDVMTYLRKYSNRTTVQAPELEMVRLTFYLTVFVLYI